MSPPIVHAHTFWQQSTRRASRAYRYGGWDADCKRWENAVRSVCTYCFPLRLTGFFLFVSCFALLLLFISKKKRRVVVSACLVLLEAVQVVSSFLLRDHNYHLLPRSLTAVPWARLLLRPPRSLRPFRSRERWWHFSRHSDTGSYYCSDSVCGVICAVRLLIVYILYKWSCHLLVHITCIALPTAAVVLIIVLYFYTLLLCCTVICLYDTTIYMFFVVDYPRTTTTTTTGNSALALLLAYFSIYIVEIYDGRHLFFSVTSTQHKTTQHKTKACMCILHKLRVWVMSFGAERDWWASTSCPFRTPSAVVGWRRLRLAAAVVHWLTYTVQK